MAAKQAIGCVEFEPFGWREFETGRKQVLARHVFKEMPSFKNVLDARRKYRITHPVVLHFAQAF